MCKQNWNESSQLFKNPAATSAVRLNQVVKPWDQVKTRVALVFPDIYDLGMSNLGLAILYDQLNRRPDALAERAYAPWKDMEAEMRAHGIPLYSLGKQAPPGRLSTSSAFTLPYESLYTNVLNILDLAGCRCFSAERDEHHPLVIAGGHAAFNPEPMSAFIDAFAIGEGEERDPRDRRCRTRRWKASGAARGRACCMRWRGIPGVYVPVAVRSALQPGWHHRAH